MTTLRVRREAATELEEALSWYEASEPNVARRLLRGYQDVVARIQPSPQAGSLVTAEPEGAGRFATFPTPWSFCCALTKCSSWRSHITSGDQATGGRGRGPPVSDAPCAAGQRNRNLKSRRLASFLGGGRSATPP